MQLKNEEKNEEKNEIIAKGYITSNIQGFSRKKIEKILNFKVSLKFDVF